MDAWKIESMWNQFNRFVGLFGAGIAGLFLLAVFTKRTSGYAALIGLLCSGGVQYLVRDRIHGVLFNVTGLVSCFVVGYVVSLVIRNRKNIDGLTIYTLQKQKD
jgi:hypothetical protein